MIEHRSFLVASIDGHGPGCRIDVVPTILEAAGLPDPRMVNGTPQRPIEGTSMVCTWDDPKSPGRQQIQYFEMVGNRGIYFDGWFAGTVHVKPWSSLQN